MRWIVVFWWLLSISAWGQKPYHVDFSNEAYTAVKKNPERQFKDSLSALRYLADFRQLAIRQGFLLASFDQLSWEQKTVRADFVCGPKFDDALLAIDPSVLQFLRQHGIPMEKYLRNLAFSPREISRILAEIQQTYENNGYPFVRVQLNQLAIDSVTLRGTIAVHPGQVVRWTAINLRGDELLSEKIISSYIQIKLGEYYDHQALSMISTRLKQIPFLEETKPAEVLFTQEGAELFLYLKSKPVSLANGVIGIQPNPVTQRVSLTGDIRLKLVNVLKRAEQFDLNWRSIQAQTQALRTQLIVPNLFRSPFGIDGQFDLYKRDSTFLELKSAIGIQYALSNGNFLKAFYRNNASNILAAGTNNPTFTNLGSVRTNYYGIGFQRQTIDYLPNPRKGMLLRMDISIGSRKASTSDTASVVTETTYRGAVDWQNYVPITKRNILKIQFAGEFYEAPQIFQNEVYRFGGQISQRGFNEEELQATSRMMLTLEYRFLLDQNSFLFAFFDQSWYENRATAYRTDTPFGLGAGLSFGTNLGTFSLSYALGSQQGNPLLFRDGKVHFGYIAFF